MQQLPRLQLQIVMYSINRRTIWLLTTYDETLYENSALIHQPVVAIFTVPDEFGYCE